MIDIKLMIKDKPFNITHDGLQFIVGENPNTNKKTGAVKWTVQHFYSTVAGLARYLVNRSISLADAASLQELREEVANMEKVFIVDIEKEIDRAKSTK